MTRTTNDLRAALIALTPAQVAALEALATGATHADAAANAEVTRETVTRWAGHHPGFRGALNLYRMTMAAEQADLARSIRRKALAIVKDQLQSADLPTALAVLKAIPPAADPIGPAVPGLLLDLEIRRTRATLLPLAPLRDRNGQIDDIANLLDRSALTDEERAESLTVRRLAEASGVANAVE